MWRKLKRLGVAQLSDGLVALPLDAKNREQLEWIADEVIESGGSAAIWLAHPASSLDEREIVQQVAEAATRQYVTVIEEARQVLASDDHSRRRTLARLQREMRRIAVADHFPPQERELAKVALDELSASCEVQA